MGIGRWRGRCVGEERGEEKAAKMKGGAGKRSLGDGGFRRCCHLKQSFPPSVPGERMGNMSPPVPR